MATPRHFSVLPTFYVVLLHYTSFYEKQRKVQEHGKKSP